MASNPLPSHCTATIIPVGTIDRIDKKAWDDLAIHASEPNSYYERWFVEASVRHLEVPGDLAFLIVMDGDARLIGLLPIRSGQTYGRTPFRTVENWLHYNQFLGSPLVRSGHEHAFWEAVISTIDEQWRGCDIAYLSELAADGTVTKALLQVCKSMKRRSAIVHRYRRALLEHGETPDGYWASTVRKKKRKEIGRLENRLAELGDVRTDMLSTAEGCAEWIDQFLTLEGSGWKSTNGAALAKEEGTTSFFREAVTAGLANGRAELLRLRVGERVIAMLVNFIAENGSFSFKIAYDEEFARYSPGILIEKANLQRLSDPAFGWMDSCAVENHPMINSLWKGRREIVRVAFPRKGARPSLIFAAVRLAERGWSAMKTLRKSEQVDVRSHDNDA